MTCDICAEGERVACIATREGAVCNECVGALVAAARMSMDARPPRTARAAAYGLRGDEARLFSFPEVA